MTTAKTQLVPFDTTPFPYRGEIPEQNKPFLDVDSGERRGHTSPRGGIYWEEPTYSDRRVLLSIPKGFDARKPALMVVYFHGNLARLQRDVAQRQQLPRQVAESGLNAVLVAPQFAVDALDSSAGRFWEPGVFGKFLAEASQRLVALAGDEQARPAFQNAPVVLVAYSGGYLPAINALEVGGAGDRMRGVMLLDALFGEIGRFADWIGHRPPAFFVSAYSRASQNENAELQRLLTERQVPVQTALAKTLAPGMTTFLGSPPDTGHLDFVTRAWVADPVKVVLARIPGFARASGR